jgi:hypothetical protein
MGLGLSGTLEPAGIKWNASQGSCSAFGSCMSRTMLTLCLYCNMTENVRLIPKAALKRTATGLCLMSFFTLVWSGMAYGGLYLSSLRALLLIFPALCIVFIINSIRLFHIVKYFPETVSPDDVARQKNTNKWFGIIFGAEGLGIFIAVNLVTNFGHPELQVPVIAVVVGLHFFPLAWLFRRSIDYYLASYSTLVAIAAIILSYEKVFNQNETLAFTGCGIAIATSAYGLYMLVVGKKAKAALRNFENAKNSATLK